MGLREFEDLVGQIQAEEEKRSTLSASLTQAHGTNPDERAKLHKLSERANVPPQWIADDPALKERVERTQAVQERAQVAQSAPRLAGWLSDPENARLAYDDIQELANIEGAFRQPKVLDFGGEGDRMAAKKARSVGKAFVGGLSSAPDRIGESMAGAGVMVADIVERALAPFPDETGMRKAVADVARQSRDFWKRNAELRAPAQAPGSAEYYAQQAGTSVGVSLAAAPYALAGEGAALGMFALSAGDDYQELRDAGFSVPSAMGMSAAQRTMEGLTEKIGVDALFKKQDVLQKAIKFTFGDLVGEEVNTLYNALQDKLTLSPEMTMGDVVQQMIDTAIVTAIAGPAQGISMGAAAKASESLLEAYQIQQQTKAQTDFLTALGDGVAASKTFARLPQKAQEAIAEMKKDGPIQDVYIPAEAFVTFYQDKELPEIDRQQLVEALATGGDISISLEKFITLPDHKSLLQDVKLSKDGMTPREAESLQVDVQRILSETPEEESTGVYDDILAQLTAVGTEQGVAEKQATLWQSVFRTLAARTGQEESGLYERYKPTITRPDAAPEEALNQTLFKVFHGSKYGISGEWKESKAYIGAAFFTDTQGIAQRYSMGETPTADDGSFESNDGEFANEVVEVFLDIKNPITEETTLEEVYGNEEDAQKAREDDFMFNPQPFSSSMDEGSDLYILAHSYAQFPKFREYLKSRGYDGWIFEDLESGGTTYIPFSSKQIKRVDQLEQRTGTKRGFFKPGTFEIGMLKDADLSTFIHESGHLYFEVISDIATQENAPAQIVEDYQTLLAWFGVASKGAMTREHYEMFARGFEQYLGEGKAPTPELQGVFGRIKEWILQVYRDLRRLNVELTDDVRKVMDRLLATDEEIAAAEKTLLPLFATAQQAGMSEEQFSAYREEAAKAGREERDKLTERVMRELQREKKREWKEARAEVRSDVRKEAEQDPVYSALQYLRTGKFYDGSEHPAGPMKLSKEALLERGIDMKKLPRGFGHIYTPENGTSPDMIAEALGFESGAQMIEAFISAPKMSEWIEGETDRRMKERFGEINIEEEAQVIVHNEKRAQILRAELVAVSRRRRQVAPFVYQARGEGKDALSREKREREYERRWMEAERKLAVAIERGAKEEEIRKLREEERAAKESQKQARKEMEEGIPSLQAFKAAAVRLVSEKKVVDLQPYDYARAEAKAGKAAFDAAAKGDYQKAGEEKSKQILNHYLYREALAAKEESEKVFEHVRRLQKEPARKRLAEAGETFLDQIDTLLAMYDFQRFKVEELRDIERLDEWAARMEAEGLAVEINVTPKPYRLATVEELRAFYDALRSIEHIAKEYRDFRTGSQRLLWEEAQGEILSSLILDSGFRSTGELGRANDKGSTIKEKGAKAWRKFDAAHLKMEQLVEWLDGGKINGPWARYVFDWADRAQTKEYDLHAQITKKIQDLSDSMPKEWHGSMLDKVTGPVRDKYTLLSAALNTGNDSNLQRLLDGWGWTQQQLDAGLENLTEEDWRFVQGIWEITESLWPEIVELQKRVSGIPPKKIEPRTIKTKYGEIQGGYFPLVYDPKHSAVGEKQADAVESVQDFMARGYGIATTPKGHTKERMETVSAPPLLDFERVLTGHMSKVIKDISHREAVYFINKVLKDKEIKNGLIDLIGEDRYREMNTWLQTLISDRADTLHQNMGFLNNFFRGLRTNTAIVTMGWKISTFLTQYAGLGPAMDLVKPRNLGNALVRFVNHPGKTIAFVAEKSGEMRHRTNTIDRDVKDALLKLRGESGAVAKAQKTAFYLAAMADRMVAVPTWIGAYEQAFSEGLAEEDAIRAGDRAVRLSQGAGGAKDLAAIQRNNDLMKLLTMYYTPFSALYARLRDVGHTTRGPKDLPRLVARSIALVLLPAVLGDLLAGRGPDDDEDEIWWTARKAVLYPFQSLPVIRDGVNGIDWWLAQQGGASGKYRPGYKISPVEDSVRKVTSALGNLADAIDGEETWDDVAWDLFESSGYVFGLPTAQPRITGEYLEDLLTEGDEEITLSEVVFRRRN